MNAIIERIVVSACPICGSSLNRTFEYFDGADLSYRLCSNCGTVFQSPRMSDEALQAYYHTEYVSQHQQASGVTEKELRIQAGRARNLIRLMNAELSTVKRHLDVGSSTGTLMQAAREAYGCEVVGVEPAEVYRAYSVASGLTVYAHLDEIGDGQFDLITLAHVVEHLPNPVEYLQKLREKWLSPTGVLLVEVPNLFGHQSGEIPHLFCFSASTLRYTLNRAGYRIAQLTSHGAPRSKLIPLYLTAIARPTETEQSRKPSARTVRLRRRIGMGWQRLATRIAPGWAWLPLPELALDE